MIFLLFFLLICIFILVIFIYVNIFYFLYLKVPMLSTGRGIIEKITSEVDFGKAKKFYELGSGSGKVISQVARKYPGLECIGIECNIAALFLAKIRNIFSEQKVEYRMQNFFKTDLRDADIVYAYLFPGIMDKLETKFLEEMKEGAMVVSNTFILKHRKPSKIVLNKKNSLGTLYVYKY